MSDYIEQANRAAASLYFGSLYSNNWGYYLLSFQVLDGKIDFSLSVTY